MPFKDPAVWLWRHKQCDFGRIKEAFWWLHGHIEWHSGRQSQQALCVCTKHWLQSCIYSSCAVQQPGEAHSHGLYSYQPVTITVYTERKDSRGELILQKQKYSFYMCDWRDLNQCTCVWKMFFHSLKLIILIWFPRCCGWGFLVFVLYLYLHI